MATFNGYARNNNGANYELVLSEVDVPEISGDQDASIRFLDRDTTTTQLEIEGLRLELRTSDTSLPGGNVFHTPITQAQYDSITEISSYTVTNSGIDTQYFYADQVELFLAPTFISAPITNRDTSTLPYIS